MDQEGFVSLDGQHEGLGNVFFTLCGLQMQWSLVEEMHNWGNTGTAIMMSTFHQTLPSWDFFFLKQESQFQEGIKPHSQAGTWVCEKVPPFGFGDLICHLDTSVMDHVSLEFGLLAGWETRQLPQNLGEEHLQRGRRRNGSI